MINVDLTRHAVERMAQRGIAELDFELIMLLGSEVEDGYLVRTKDCLAAERQLKQLMGKIRRLSGRRVVVADGRVVTAYRAEARKQRRLLRRAAERDMENRS